jgi:GT2 family glycosyltransferase
VTFLASDAEVVELNRRARRAGISVARYVAAAALENTETASERRAWAIEVARAERVMRRVEKLLREIGVASTPTLSDLSEVLDRVRDAAQAVVEMGRAAAGR